MRSRSGRWLVCAIAVLALAASGYLVFRSEEQISARRSSLRVFEASAREAALSLADLRAAEQAYVAAGQGVAFWMPKVAALVETAEHAIDTLRGTAADADARTALTEAASSITEFKDIDKRARDYVTSSQSLMAADVVFTEGGEAVATAAKRVDAAGVAEHLGFDEFDGAQRKTELYALSAAAAVAVLAMMLLAGAPEGADSHQDDMLEGAQVETSIAPRSTTAAAASVPAAPPLRESAPVLRAAAALCTDFGRVRDAEDLRDLLARAADALDAQGLVVWLGSPAGAHLRPVIAHGYPPQLLERMTAIPRTADNAAAAAYRTGVLQIVLSRPGGAPGALVAPLITPDGCIGSLTAEIKHGAESSEAVQSLAVIFAAQLAGVLAGSAQADADTAAAPPRAAANL